MQVQISNGVEIVTPECASCRGYVLINGHSEDITAFGKHAVTQCGGYSCLVEFTPFSESSKEVNALCTVYGFSVDEVKKIQGILTDLFNTICTGCN